MRLIPNTPTMPTGSANRRSSTYYDDFLVTSLTVQQDLGGSALIIAENGASSAYESDLWHLADTLQDTYSEAQTVNGERLTPLFQIPAHLDAWGISSSNLTVAPYAPGSTGQDRWSKP
ncbi:MAG: hypothetical protein R2932_60170 [Caldilineaceae bacterium]